MNRLQLAHILRAACQVTGDPDVLVIGSQSILGTYDDSVLPPTVVASMEADVAFLNDPKRLKADAVEGVLGEMSPFHDNNLVYAEGIHVDTAELPAGWRDRLVTWDLQSSAPATPWFLDPHDLVVSKLAARREKDVEFCAALLDADLVDLDVLDQRASLLPRSSAPVSSWLSAYRRRFGT